jgi:hypothetical protein
MMVKKDYPDPKKQSRYDVGPILLPKLPPCYINMIPLALGSPIISIFVHIPSGYLT